MPCQRLGHKSTPFLHMFEGAFFHPERPLNVRISMVGWDMFFCTGSCVLYSRQTLNSMHLVFFVCCIIVHIIALIFIIFSLLSQNACASRLVWIIGAIVSYNNEIWLQTHAFILWYQVMKGHCPSKIALYRYQYAEILKSAVQNCPTYCEGAICNNRMLLLYTVKSSNFAGINFRRQNILNVFARVEIRDKCRKSQHLWTRSKQTQTYNLKINI